MTMLNMVLKYGMTIILILSLNTIITAQIDILKNADVTFSQESMELKLDTNVVVIEPRIFMSTQMTDDGLMIRWAPNDLSLWLDGIDQGYTLQKVVFPEDSTESAYYVDVLTSPIKPWKKSQWETIISEEKPYCAAAAQCIYGLEREDKSGFVIKQENQKNLFGFSLLSADLDRDAAIASGLGYLDTSVKEKGLVMYRIFLNESPLAEYQDTIIVSATGSFVEQPRPEIIGANESENSIQLNWKNGKGRFQYTAFYIEKSKDGNTFHRITPTPYLPMTTNITAGRDMVTYVDSVHSNFETYYYRIIGINSFAELSAPSEVIKAMGRDRTPPNTPVNLTCQENNDGMTVINWDWEDINNDNDLFGFYLLKSTEANGEYDTLNKSILPIDTKRYIDHSPDVIATNYYKVIAVDKYGNTSTSSLSFLITTDDIPPSPPTELKAEIDNNGMMLLTWEPSVDKDVRGYLVHFSNGKEANYAVIPGDYLTEPYYLDSLTLNTLTEEIYYYVVALDLSYNASEISEIIEVKKPDIIPPSPSIFVDYRVSEEGIYFEWIKSASTDVEKVILRRKEKENNWLDVLDFDETKNTYTDINVKGGELYHYQLVTIDDDGNNAESTKPLILEALTPFFIPMVSKLDLNKEENVITISWDYENLEDHKFIIYRKIGDGPLKTLKHLSGMNNFQDSSLKKDQEVSYALKAKAKDGRESKLSAPIKIKM